MRKSDDFILLNVVVIIYLLLISTGCAHGGNLKSKLDSYVKAFADQDKFSGSVLVAKEGKILLNKGYGMANYELNIPNTPKTKFRLASLTKQFTAMAIMQLQQKGLLNVHDEISKYIPDYPDGNKITIHHLLTHSSGIHDVGYLPSFRQETIRPHTIEQIVDLYKNFPLKFNPGEKYSYSNTGYILLSLIIEKVSHKSYDDYLRDSIFTPLNMHNSGLDHNDAIIMNRASGYKYVDGKILNSDFVHMSFPSGAGALYSTVEDLYLWDRSLYSASVLSKEFLSIMLQPKIAINANGSYAYGFSVEKHNGKNLVGHSGGIEGFSTHIRRYVDDDVCIIILGNIERLDKGSISKGLAAIVFGEEYALPKRRTAVPVNPTMYDNYVGKYRFDDGSILAIIKEDNRLFARPADQGKIELFPESETDFFHKMIEVQITFLKDQSGKSSRLVLRNPKESIAERID